MTGQLVPQAKAIAARRAIASPRRKREGCIRSTPDEVSGNACGDRVPTETRAGEASRLESSRLRRCVYNGEIASPVRHSSARIRQAPRLLRSSEQHGRPALSVMTTQHMEGVPGMSRARILTLSCVAAITLGSGALAQGGGGGGGGAGGGASGAGGAAGGSGAGSAAGASGAHGAAGASSTPGTGNPNSPVSVQPPGSTGQNAINSPGTGPGPGPNPTPK